ncbi:MAG TPA: hypothetical protein VHR72_07275, partial [Gemmataceae bacterium]|nr:hypothetical protein [Gemmataceae bacterium]
MSKARRDEAKKRRREKRKSKSIRGGSPGVLGGILASLGRQLELPGPACWPGACHPSVARPDHVKFEIADVLNKSGRPSDLCGQLERRLQQGLLGKIPDIEDWGMEEFLWHGMPDGSYHPIDAFLHAAGDRFPPEARQQILRWKQARIGVFHVGAVADDTVELREWDAVDETYVGASFRAISLNIGGVGFYRSQKGYCNVTYVAPWAPEQNLFCAMGYGLALPRAGAPPLEYLVRGMRDLPTATFPLPWEIGEAVRAQC